MAHRFSLEKFPLQGKTVFLRVDYNVPLKKGKVVDNYKIKSSLPTIKFLLKQKCKLVIATHIGRPKGKKVAELSTGTVAKELQLLLKKKVIKVKGCIGKKTKDAIKGKNQIFFLENLRFYQEEEKNDPAFAHALANLAEVYVNDAFAVSHRQHASVYAITNFLPSIPGLLFEKELRYLSKALHPKRPAVWIIGGAKLNKVDLFKQAKADYILVGGALAFAFMKAQHIPVGMSKTDSQSATRAAWLLKNMGKKIILPIDFMVSEKFSAQASSRITNCIHTNEIGLDLGPETIKLFQRYLRKARTVVWNGPLGYFEWSQYAVSTREIGRYLTKLTATTICGGGETAEAVKKFHLQDKVSHLSTGGGATLEFLSGKKLVGIVALEKNWQRFKKQ